ncbi:UNVERIFIED_CONTAM: hypothetical protein Scaly_2620400 [Sesamum calycinum]|uniref:Uncharacterized protein n=1 Tax=Sesamum calycinum TaxID=2727403 RepID=A0AAW2JDA6_9LAMI
MKILQVAENYQVYSKLNVADPVLLALCPLVVRKEMAKEGLIELAYIPRPRNTPDGSMFCLIFLGVFVLIDGEFLLIVLFPGWKFDSSCFKAASLYDEVRRVENKVANGCVTRGNLPNSSGQILKKAKKRCLMSLRSISHTGTETRPGLPRGQQWGILDNGRKPDPAISRVAWLSSARVVRCLVKSYNERNPRFVLLRHAPKEKVFATELARLTNKIERAFLACLVKSSFGPTLAGDDDVELTAEKDSAFRRSARWCGGDDVKSAWPLWAGPHTCYNGNYNGKQGCKAERIRKDCLSSDCSLQLGNMKLESLVIADQHAAVNMYSGPVHTARHTLGIGFARSIGPMITHDFCVTLVPQRLLVGLLAHTTEGSLEKSFNCAIPLVSEPPAINRASFPPRTQDVLTTGELKNSARDTFSLKARIQYHRRKASQS